MKTFREYLAEAKIEKEVDLNESKFDLNKLKDVIKHFTDVLTKHSKEENIMEIHGDFNSLKKTIDAWLPILSKEIEDRAK